ncbi:hypothetical protein GR160_08385 [Flavobacterium sp. Sd200]|uniref:hypothetical protein n=1 Tax=Flavobacterium sp. Sd200 TaxID=2692211 RepID=UPI00136E29A0|nr:hypothetical protein [Flavobacterium sp. Sd200]MXN91245.1 hypothetical protein [Flavobacterium sp. Sd200]
MLKLTALLLLVCTTAFCQERKPLYGKVEANKMGLTAVFVINKATGAEVKTDSSGNFTLNVSPGDVIVAYSARTTVREFAVSEASFTENPYVIEVEMSAEELEEVIVDASVTSQKLGIVPANQKQFTQAERHLYTTGDFKPIMLLGLLAGSMPLDPVINAINGRTKAMKKLVELEKREQLLEKLHNICTVTEITDNLKIPDEHVEGFLYFVTEDKEVQSLLANKSESLAKFKITGLAQNYLDRINHE